MISVYLYNKQGNEMKTVKQITKVINDKMAYALDYITVRNGEVEIYVEVGGEADVEAIQAIKEDFQSNFKWGGFRAGYGAGVLKENYAFNNLIADNID